jgi:hypothetical protein
LPVAGTGCYVGRVAANIYQAVKQAMQDLIAPQIESLRGDIGALRADVGGVRSEVHALRSEMHSEIRRIDDKLTWALDLRERIVAIEARLGPAPTRS